MAEGSEDRAREQRHRLTGGRLLAKNTLFTLGSHATIVAVQIAAVPILIHKLGTARFGVLTLAWVMIGYAGHFDLGLGRALTKLTAERLGGGGDEHEISRLFWTATGLLALLGLVAAAIVAALSPLLVNDVLKIPEHLEQESLITFLLLAASLPFVFVSAAQRGSLEAQQRFDITSAVAVPFSFLSYFGPVVMSFISPNLALAVSALLLSRVLACIVLLVLCLRVDPGLRSDRRLSRPLAGTLLRFGGWITASAILAPLVASLDRFVVGALVSAQAVAYYATAFEAVKQVRVVAFAVSGVLFPAFSATAGTEQARAEIIFRRGTRGVLLVLFPIAFFCLVFAPEILGVWVGEDFASNSAGVMQWLSAGILVHGVASVAYGMVQSVRPDLVFKIHLAELPFYILAFWVLIDAFGREGAAMAWSGRIVVDGVLLFAVLRRLGLIGMDSALQIVRPLVASLAVFAVAVQLDDVTVKAAFFSAALVAFMILGWFRVLELQERTMLRGRLRLLMRPSG